MEEFVALDRISSEPYDALDSSGYLHRCMMTRNMRDSAPGDPHKAIGTGLGLGLGIRIAVC